MPVASRSALFVLPPPCGDVMPMSSGFGALMVLARAVSNSSRLPLLEADVRAASFGKIGQGFVFKLVLRCLDRGLVAVVRPLARLHARCPDRLRPLPAHLAQLQHRLVKRAHVDVVGRAVLNKNRL